MTIKAPEWVDELDTTLDKLDKEVEKRAVQPQEENDPKQNEPDFEVSISEGGDIEVIDVKGPQKREYDLEEVKTWPNFLDLVGEHDEGSFPLGNYQAPGTLPTPANLYDRSDREVIPVVVTIFSADEFPDYGDDAFTGYPFVDGEKVVLIDGRELAKFSSLWAQNQGFMESDGLDDSVETIVPDQNPTMTK